MLIHRCVCTNRSFAELLCLARRKGFDQDSLSACTGAGNKCTLCRPYLRCTLETEQTEFIEIMTPDECNSSAPGQP